MFFVWCSYFSPFGSQIRIACIKLCISLTFVNKSRTSQIHTKEKSFNYLTVKLISINAMLYVSIDALIRLCIDSHYSTRWRRVGAGFSPSIWPGYLNIFFGPENTTYTQLVHKIRSTVRFTIRSTIRSTILLNICFSPAWKIKNNKQILQSPQFGRWRFVVWNVFYPLANKST